jgi:hypothetical protein
MPHHPLHLLAIGAFALLAATSAASAGCCPVGINPCACAPMPQVAAPPVEMLVVNQGPVYSGPGSYVTQRNFIEGDQTAPYGYPPVGWVPADTRGFGYRGFYSNSFYPPGYGPRYRSVHAKPRAYPQYPSYK